jgi:hypothetical protein
MIPFKPSHNWGNIKVGKNVKIHKPQRIHMPVEVALAMLGPRSKEAKAIRRMVKAKRIVDRQWWPGLHTRWWMEGQER